MRFRATLAVAAVVAGGLFLPAQSAHSADKFITVGTGGIVGVYYPLGGAICRFVNAGRKDHGYRCTGESTGGSVLISMRSCRATWISGLRRAIRSSMP
jgi:uncharacterized protein